MQIRLCAVLGLLLGWARVSSADILYSVTDLNTLGGYYSTGAGINNSGQVTGSSTPDGGFPFHAFLYSSGQLMDLGPPGGSSYGFAINGKGQVTGISGSHAFLYSSGQMTDLGTLGAAVSYGQGINNSGQVTGYSFTSTPAQHAFLYSNGQMMDLGTLGGDASSGSGINESGQVTGSSNTSAGVPHAFLYSNGHMADLGMLDPAGSGSFGAAVNNSGQVTGYSDTADGLPHAFLYDRGQMLDLGTIGEAASYGTALNSNGQIVGNLLFGVDAGNRTAGFLYSNGQMMELGPLIDPALNLTLYEATGINDKGQIVANGFDSGRAGIPHAFLLTPVPEPGTLTLLGAAFLALGCWRWRLGRAHVTPGAIRYANPSAPSASAADSLLNCS